MEGITIGEVSRETGIASSAIRYYEGLGLLPEPPRRSGWRRFPRSVVTRLLVIKTARALGFTLADIRVLLCDFAPDASPPERWRAIATEKLPVIEEMIRRASGMKHLLEAGLACRCSVIEECFLDGCEPDSARGGPQKRRTALPILEG
jgi:MerR family redox-sensitive transcriptional activator SoxR